MRITFNFLIISILSELFLLNGFSQTIRIHTNSEIYQPADKIDVLLDVKNPDAESSVDILILFLTPSGRYFWGMIWSEIFTKAAEKVLLPSGLDITNFKIAEFDVPNSDPSIMNNGQYILAAAFVKSGTLELIGAISTANFNVTGLPFLLSISENGTSDFSGFEDVYLDEIEPNQNWDTHHIQIKGNSSDEFKKVTLFRVDISNIPDDAIIVDAWIDLYLFLDKKYGTFGAEMYEMDSQSEVGADWIEDEATWYTYDGENPWTGGKDGGAGDEGNQITVSKSHEKNEGDGWYSYKFNDYGKSYIQSRIKAGEKLNIRFKTQETDGMTRFSRIFFDSEVSDPPHRPVLYVKYIHNPEQTPQPTPTVTPTDPQNYTTVTFGLRGSDSFSGNWEDTWVYKYVYAQRTNYGNYKILGWRNHEDYTKYTHIKVDITELLDVSEIYKARLYFYLYKSDSRECSVTVDSLNVPNEGDWLEDKDTWRSYDGNSNWTNNNGGNYDRGQNLGSSIWSKEVGWHYIQFNSDGLQYLIDKAKDGVCSFIVGLDSQLGTKNDYKHELYSSEWDDDTMRPYMQIIYKDGGTPTNFPVKK